MFAWAVFPLPGQRISASSSCEHPPNWPAHRIGGVQSLLTLGTWNSGDFAPAHVEIDLGRSYRVRRITSLAHLVPDGHVVISVTVGEAPQPLTVAYLFNGALAHVSHTRGGCVRAQRGQGVHMLSCRTAHQRARSAR